MSRTSAVADRQDGDYSPPVLAPAAGGPIPQPTMDNAPQETPRSTAGGATAGVPPVTEESG